MSGEIDTPDSGDTSQDSSRKSVDDYIVELQAKKENPNQIISVDSTTSSADVQLIHPQSTALDTKKDALVHKPGAKSLLPMADMGPITAMRARRIKGAKQLEAATIVYNAALKQLEVEAEASVRENKAFWDAKSAEVAETIRTYVQNSLAFLSVQRMESKVSVLRRASEHVDMQLKDIATSDMAEHLKSELIANILASLNTATNQIVNNVLADKYELADDTDDSLK